MYLFLNLNVANGIHLIKLLQRLKITNHEEKTISNIWTTVLAAVLLAVVLVTPFNFTKPDSEEIHEASLSQSNNIFKGTAVKKAAFEQNYVPFMGSSELSRMDAFHPASMALRY